MKYNNFPKCVIDQLLSEVQLEDPNIRSSIQENQNDVNKTAHLLVLPFAVWKGEKLLKSMKNSLKCVSPKSVITRLTCSGTRLNSKFTKIMLLLITLNVQKVSAQKTILEKRPED